MPLKNPSLFYLYATIYSLFPTNTAAQIWEVEYKYMSKRYVDFYDDVTYDYW